MKKRRSGIVDLAYGRFFSTIYAHDKIWSVIQKRAGEQEAPAVFIKDNGILRCVDINTRGLCCRPTLLPAADGVYVFWNEVREKNWGIICARLAPDGRQIGYPEEVHTSGAFLLPPAAAVFCGRLYVVWAGAENGRLRIHLAAKHDAGWKVIETVSPADVDAFRPQIAAGGDRLAICWDQYRNQQYEIGITDFDGDKCDAAQCHRMPGERRLGTRIACVGHNTFLLVWSALREVADELGIADHFAYAAGAEYAAGEFKMFQDADNPELPQIIADFREGLLAEQEYMGYYGLRRNPYLAVAGNGELYCLWEVKIEAEKQPRSGYLAARKWSADKGWGVSEIIHGGGYCYAPAQCADGHVIATAFLKYSPRAEDIVRLETIELGNGSPYQPNPVKWKRWRSVSLVAPPANPASVSVGETTYKLFWADTHVHGIMSPDAEGELDELVHFGRDMAGLQVMSVTDNDYYPHKELTEAEWRLHQAFARHFTRPGKFALLPGYEYTFHDDEASGKPVFNHRIIIHPYGGEVTRRTDTDGLDSRAFFRKLAGADVISYPHHPTYKIYDNTIDRNVEICSSWRVVLEEHDFTIRQLRAGMKLGFIGSSDTHRSVPGLGGALTGIWAESLTVESIVDAYRNRRLIATQGHQVMMNFKVNDLFVGEAGACGGSVRITGEVMAPETIEKIDVVRDGENIHTLHPMNIRCRFEYEDKNVVAGGHFYFMRVKLTGDPSCNMNPALNAAGIYAAKDTLYPHNLARAKGPFAWTSPVWMAVEK